MPHLPPWEYYFCGTWIATITYNCSTVFSIVWVLAFTLFQSLTNYILSYIEGQFLVVLVQPHRDIEWNWLHTPHTLTHTSHLTPHTSHIHNTHIHLSHILTHTTHTSHTTYTSHTHTIHTYTSHTHSHTRSYTRNYPMLSSLNGRRRLWGAPLKLSRKLQLMLIEATRQS